METKNILTIGNLHFKITSEKLFIETFTGSETYALRSINGISVKDDINDYNSKINAMKYDQKVGRNWIISGVVFLIFIIIFAIKAIVFGVIMGGIFCAIGFYLKNKTQEPRLVSFVRITMNSGDKVFEFFKDESKADEVAQFVACLEDTLTAFHKE